MLANGRRHEDLALEAMERTLASQRVWSTADGVRPVPRWRNLEHCERMGRPSQENPQLAEYAAVESQITKEDDEGNSLSPLAALSNIRQPSRKQ